MIVWGTSDNALLERLLQKHNATLSKVISAGHAAEETRKHAHENLRSQPTTNIDKIFKKKLNQPSRNIHNQNTRDLTKKCKFCNSSHPRGKCLPYEKVCYVCNKRNYFKVSCLRVGKKVHEIENDESDEPFE